MKLPKMKRKTTLIRFRSCRNKLTNFFFKTRHWKITLISTMNTITMKKTQRGFHKKNKLLRKQLTLEDNKIHKLPTEVKWRLNRISIRIIGIKSRKMLWRMLKRILRSSLLCIRLIKEFICLKLISKNQKMSSCLLKDWSKTKSNNSMKPNKT